MAARALPWQEQFQAHWQRQWAHFHSRACGALVGGGGYTISIRRPGTNSQACSASPIISPTNRRNIKTASICIFDWGASQFLTKQFQVGLVGYVYKEVGCDSGSGDRLGCFQSQVVGSPAEQTASAPPRRMITK